MISALYFYLAFTFFHLPVLGIKLGSLSDFPIKKVSEGVYETSRGARLTISAQEAASEESARSLMADGQYLIQGMYGARVNPYQGAISRENVCNVKRAMPVLTSKENPDGFEATFKLMANEYFTYGVCDPQDFRHRSFYKILYCRAKGKIFRIKYFAHTDATDAELDALAGEVRCR